MIKVLWFWLNVLWLYISIQNTAKTRDVIATVCFHKMVKCEPCRFFYMAAGRSRAKQKTAGHWREWITVNWMGCNYSCRSPGIGHEEHPFFFFPFGSQNGSQHVSPSEHKNLRDIRKMCRTKRAWPCLPLRAFCSVTGRSHYCLLMHL